eukprot:TRINITY_DN27799_c0_g1_i1.p1 TRINITY_DN27799_c0_g1~~TRINITY_DN27799_c0_g1_i1.p1  ORF type:complete len:309 (+),score=80.96 TRINITY_DN27799_c0_g1_i1:42-929(+)
MEELDKELGEKRILALKELSAKGGCDCNVLLDYHKHVKVVQRVAEGARPGDDIDSSLPNHEQDRLIDERATHISFEQNLELERIKIIYNTAMCIAKTANTCRFQINAPTTPLQEAAGIFDLLANTPLPIEGIPNEISPDYLRILALLCLASQAEKTLLERQVAPLSQWEACTHLCYSINHYYVQVSSLIKHAKNKMDRAAGAANINHILNFAAVKQDFYKALALEFHSMQPGTKRYVSRLRKALRGYESAFGQLSKQLPGMRNNVEKEINYRTARVRAKLSEVTDNGCCQSSCQG